MKKASENPKQSKTENALTQTINSVKDFQKNYKDMIEANTVGADKFFHCKANCEATKRGSAGKATASVLSGFREFTDMFKVFRNNDYKKDQEANVYGRNNAHKPESCGNICEEHAPKALDRKYK